MTTNAELHERHREVLPSWLALYYEEPISMDRGEGRHVFDTEGQRYLDFFGGILTTSLGYDIPEVTAAVADQAARTLHSSTLYLSEPMIELAELVCDLSGIPDARVFFTTSGTEANDAALLLATSYRRSNQILALRNSYHGRSFSTIAITAHRAWSPTSLSGLSVNYVHGGYRLRSPFRELDDDAYTTACVDDLTQVFDMMTSGEVAAMIAEPIQGVGGFTTPPDGFFGAIKKELDNRGVLFISDEVQTGWGRTGDHFWGYQAHGMVPDMLTFAKGVGNGLALGGVVARAEVMEAMGANSISTFGGNPLACAVANKILEVIDRDGLAANARALGQFFLDELARLREKYPTAIREVRGLGLMIGIEMCGGFGSFDNSKPAAVQWVFALHEAGLLTIPAGSSVIRFLPPLNLTQEEAQAGLDLFEQTIQKVIE